MSTWLLAGLVAALQAVSFSAALEASEQAPVLQAAAAAEVARRAHGERLSRMTHNPVLQVQPGARAMAQGGSGAELYLSVSQRVNLSGWSKRRREAVARELMEDASSRALLRQQIRRAVVEAWLARWSAQQAEEVALREQALSADLLASVETMLRAGEATVLEQAAARTWAAEAELSSLTFEDESLSAGVTLARLLGHEATVAQPVDSALPAIDVRDAALETSAVVGAPAVASAAATRAADQSRLDEVAAARGPTMAFGALGWREGGGDLAAVATLEIDLPVFERGERERATAAAQLERARGQERSSVLAAQAERVLWQHDLGHTRQVLEVVEHKLLPSAHAVADALLVRVQARESTAQEWVLARRQVLRSELETIRAQAGHVLARFLVAEAQAMEPVRP